MCILKFEHEDFTLSVKTENFLPMFDKAKRYNNTEFLSEYKIIPVLDNNHEIVFINEIGEIRIEDRNGLVIIEAPPIFFENHDYNIIVDFNDERIENARIFSPLKIIASKFFFYKNKNILTGTLNFYNNIGKSNLIIRYEKVDEFKEVIFSFEVFPIKLNYKKDLSRIINFINKEYPNLVLSYLRSTFVEFSDFTVNEDDIVWWKIFEKIYDELINTFRYIIEKPHYKIIRNERYVVADKIKKWTTRLEEEFSMFKHLPRKRYRTINYFLSSDTFENRFFKYVVIQSTNKYKRIKNFIKNNYEITEEYEEGLRKRSKKLEEISHHPFFKTIGEFRGFRQQSLVLEKATGYSKLYKLWLLLRSGYNLFEGVFDVSLKNIAELYQIWCFLKIKKIIEEIVEPEKTKIIVRNIFEDVSYGRESGIKTEIIYIKKDMKIELLHEFEFSETTNPKTYTSKQRPDITIKITKSDILENYTLTYIFDAKYRIDIGNDGEVPPEDAINQMHRYRDAIYYENKISRKNEKIPEKEIIGAYVIFPAQIDEEKWEENKFFKSIEKINVGAIPLSPTGNNENILKSFLKEIINKTSYKVLEEDIIPQKKMKYEPINAIVLIGKVPDEDHLKSMNNNKYCYVVENKQVIFGFDKLKYFAPYIQDKGIKEYFKIIGYEIKKRNEIFKKGDSLYKRNDNSERLIIYLDEKKHIKDKDTYFKLENSGTITYRYTFLYNLRNLTENKEIKTYSYDEINKILTKENQE